MHPKTIDTLCIDKYFLQLATLISCWAYASLLMYLCWAYASLLMYLSDTTIGYLYELVYYMNSISLLDLIASCHTGLINVESE